MSNNERNRNLRVKVKSCLLSIFFGLFLNATANACSCMFSSLKVKINNSDNIFLVETTDINIIEKAEFNSGGGLRRASFNVLETFKGSAIGSNYIQSADEPVCCMCQSKVKNNTKYLVFQSNDNPIVLSSCGYTYELDRVARELDIVRALSQPQKNTEIYNGIYIARRQELVNDDGQTIKTLYLDLDDSEASMSRVSFHAVKLANNKLVATRLLQEYTLTSIEQESFKQKINSRIQKSQKK